MEGIIDQSILLKIGKRIKQEKQKKGFPLPNFLRGNLAKIYGGKKDIRLSTFLQLCMDLKTEPSDLLSEIKILS